MISERPLVHEALVIDTDSALVDRSRSFIEEGLDQAEPVMIVAPPSTLDLLHRDVGSAVKHAAVLENAEQWWRGPHATMAAYVASMQELKERDEPWRLLAQPTWLAAENGRYWSRFEAVANVALADYRYHSLCVHDRRTLPAEVIETAKCTHPLIDDGGGTTASPDWQEPADFLRSVEPTLRRPPVSATATTTADLRSARGFATEVATRAGLDAARSGDLVLVVNELVANALDRTDMASIVSWIDGTELLVQVRDNGPGFDDAYAGYLVPSPSSPRGRGLWMARSLADDLRIEAPPGSICIQTHWQPA